MRGSSRRTLITGMAMATAALAFVQQPRPPRYQDRPECPHSWNKYFSDRKFIVPPGPPSRFLISGDITNVPEFHDCQKLVFRTPGAQLQYGELAAVFARMSLDSVLQSNKLPPGGFALAEILSESDYPSLGVRRGFSCLMFVASNQARMIALGVDHRNWKCQGLETSALPAGATVREMGVDITAAHSAVPPVARWDWDTLGGGPLIGIKCLPNAWCTFGPHGAFKSVAAPGGPLSSPLTQVKGWHDAQYLATATTAPTPTQSYGIAFPSPKLATLNARSDFKDQWQPGAYVAMTAVPSGYNHKFGYAPTNPGAIARLDSLNRVDLCTGSSSSCGIPLPYRTKCNQPQDTLNWWARITPAPGTGRPERYFCVAYRPHTGNFTIPPVVRWRWRADDETLWIRCPYGCCEVDAKK